MKRAFLRAVSRSVAAAVCASFPLFAAFAESAEPGPLRALAAALSRQADPDALATAALLYDSVNAHADALDRAREAARLAPERADLAWLELQLCTQRSGCATDAPTRRLTTLDPLNGAAFLHELEQRSERASPAVDRVLLRISHAERIDFYWNPLVVAANEALARSDLARGPAGYSPMGHAVGMVVSVALPNLNGLTTACKAEQIEDSTRRDLCLRIARALQRGDTVLAEALGMGIEKRLWPAGSREAAAIDERRQALRELQEAQAQFGPDAQWTARMIEALRTHRTEREAGAAVLAQYRASGQTAARQHDSTTRAAPPIPLTSDAALAGAATNIHAPGRARMRIEFLNVNFLAVLVAALSSFLLGGLWYSRALFGATWTREAGVSMEKQGHKPMVFVTSYLLAFVAAWLFAALLPAEISTAQATVLGALIGIAWVATSFGINYGFGQRSLTLWLIDAGYHTLQFTLFGAIIGAWR